MLSLADDDCLLTESRCFKQNTTGITVLQIAYMKALKMICKTIKIKEHTFEFFRVVTT